MDQKWSSGQLFGPCYQGTNYQDGDKKFSIQWIPSHVGIVGNEEVDELGNRGTLLEEVSPLKITYSDALSEIKNLMLKE